MKMKTVLYTITGLMLFLASCVSDPRTTSNYKPRSYGQLNQIDFVIDDELWATDLRDTVEYYYQAPYLLLPIPEPILDIRQYPVSDLTNKPARQVQKTIVIAANMEDDSSPTTKFVVQSIGEENLQRAKENPKAFNIVGRDRWARDQNIIYVLGFGEEQLKRNLCMSFQSIAMKVKSSNTEMLHAQTYPNGSDPELRQLIQDKYSLVVDVPIDYVHVAQAADEKFTWLRRDKGVEITNLFFYKIPYDSKDDLSKAKIKEIRNLIGRTYVESDKKGSIMQINDKDLPIIYQNRTLDNQFAIEARGIWEMSEEFIGGPFMSYLVHNPAKNEIIFIDGFVVAPGEDKRNIMLRLEHIIERIEVPQ